MKQLFPILFNRRGGGCGRDSPGAAASENKANRVFKC